MAEFKKSNININVSLDENRVPEELHWSAEDGGVENEEAKAMLLSMWDPHSKETLSLDLWTKDMPLEEMKMFFYQTLMNMNRTFYKATQDQKMTDTMKDFCDYFAEKMEIDTKKK